MTTTKATKVAAPATVAPVAPATPVQALTPRPVRVAAHAGMVAAAAKLATGTASPTVPRGVPATLYLTAQGIALGAPGAAGSGLAWALAQCAYATAQATGGNVPQAGHAVNSAMLAAALVRAGITPGYLAGSYVAGSAKHAKGQTNKQRLAVLAYAAPT